MTHSRQRKMRVLDESIGSFIKRSAGLIAYWDLQEPSGTNVACFPNNTMDGTTAGATVAHLASQELGLAYLFDGNNDDVDIYSAALNTAFTTGEFSSSLFYRPANVGTWTDGVRRNLLTLSADSSNYSVLTKHNNSNQIQAWGNYGGTFINVLATGLTTIDWIHVFLTSSLTNDELSLYINGVLTQTKTGLGTWVNPLNAATTVIGAATTVPTNVTDGYISQVAIWNTPKGSEFITKLARIGDVV